MKQMRQWAPNKELTYLAIGAAMAQMQTLRGEQVSPCGVVVDWLTGGEEAKADLVRLAECIATAGEHRVTSTTQEG